MELSVLGLITARGGSKSIPRKNVADLGGKPLIAWTIEAALASRGLSRVIVSTDDEEIAEVSRRWGAQVPFMRPPELARDDSSHMSVADHALRWLESREGIRSDYLMLLQPTSPLRTVEDIQGAIQLACDKDGDGVVSVSEAHPHPFLMKRIADDSTLADFMEGVPQPGSTSIRRQALPHAYGVNGAIYLTKRDVLLSERTFLPTCTYPYIMPKERSLEIDEPWDLDLVRLILERKNATQEH